MKTQSSNDTEVGYSATGMLMLVVLGVGMTLLSASMAFNWYGEKHIDGFHILVGYFGVLFFGVGTCKFGWTWLTAHGPILFVSRYGIRDLRVANALIPWNSITGISSLEYGQQKSILLAITPELEARLFAGSGHAMHLAGKAAGVNGVAIGTGGLEIDADELLRMFQEYYYAAKTVSAPRPLAGTVPHPMKRAACRA